MEFDAVLRSVGQVRRSNVYMGRAIYLLRVSFVGEYEVLYY